MSKIKHIVIDRTTGNFTKIEEIPADIDPREYLRRAIADCPECSAAMARGEVPHIGHGNEIETLVDRTRRATARQTVFGRRPRWRTRRRA